MDCIVVAASSCLSRVGGHLTVGHAVKMAGGHVSRVPAVVSDWPEQRLLAPAAGETEWAAGMEAAASGRVDRARHIATQDDPPASGRWVRDRHGGKQCARV